MNNINHKRLLKDIVDVIKNPLEDNGIYYIHDETNMLQGYALIIGPSDTLYANGYYLFQITYPVEYPFAPPKLKYLTNNGHTRFHPNLYRSGKVCLSILNTWRGEQWTSCQTIRSVLLTLVTLFHNKPLLNEPGITEKHKDFKKYNEIIEFENYNTSILNVINKKITIKNNLFYDIIIKHYNKLEIEKKLLKKITIKKKITLCIYNNMSSYINYEKLYENFKKIQIDPEILKLEKKN
jgi:ubiquitin-conjugating enzyme E2 Z